jgi:uncharacterized protein YndB with AHSA1/START domain
MPEQVKRELLLPASVESVWTAVTGPGWLADEVHFELRPGGDASFSSRDGVKVGWVEEALVPSRLTFWWAAEGEPATRVQLELEPHAEGTVLRAIETRPLELLDLVGTPLSQIGGTRFGPALVAA